MTNEEKIKSMTAEQFARWMVGFQIRAMNTARHSGIILGPKIWEEWLKEEAVEETAMEIETEEEFDIEDYLLGEEAEP